ncbi:TRPM8 channel-associated factor like [Actinidia chinensis var. chinensis]|uniref:TRPM8 channel-associated factor like n=1 Tax=Actinidia chinensis var. chinensis TaxID=1590841 RepID=A0A2R6RBU2_ACTCC|nr:TRPM8 channel-associated factor like [Actinidia chinensis var. chinensis]
MDSINILNPQFNNRRLQKITTLFRFIEFFFFLLLVSRFSLQIPFNFNLSGDFFRRIYAAVFSPRFVFVLGNVIVITLFLKSGCSGNKSNSDFCAEYVGNVIEPRRRDKENGITVETDDCRERKICRSRSENLGREGGVKQSGQLRQSAPKRLQKSDPAEDMTGEEFRRAVEAFNERQQRLLREEEFSGIIV